MPLVSPVCKPSPSLFSCFVCAVEVAPELPAKVVTLLSTPAPTWLPYFPYPAGPSHHSVEPPFEFMCHTLSKVRGKGMRDLEGRGLISVYTLPLFSGLQGSVLPLSGLVTATTPLTTGPLHMYFPLLRSPPCQCFTSWLSPSDLSYRNTSGFQLLHFTNT